MDRSEWILVIAVLSVGLIGASATVGVLFQSSAPAAVDSTTSTSVQQAASYTGVAGAGASSAGAGTGYDTQVWLGEAETPVSTIRSIAWNGPQEAVVATSGAPESVLWLLYGGAIGLVLVAAVTIVRYGGLPANHGGSSEATVEPRTDDGVKRGDVGGPSAGASTGADQASEADPIADDERVEQLLEDGGGRMKQTAIVEETEWSKSKVSMLLSEMESDGRIKKIQVGRENIIALEGHEPEAVNSPFEDAE